MIKSLLRATTASALVFAATIAVAQDTKTTETTKTTTTTDATPTAETTTKVKTKKKVKAPATATEAAATTETRTTTESTATTATTDGAAAAATPPAAAAAPATAAPAPAAPAAAPTTPNPAVGGAAMDAGKTIVDNASAAPNLTTLVTAVKAADLAGTLAGPGPFTVFAPTNDAFGRIDKATLANLMKPENKTQLAKILTYHVVPGTITAADLVAKADATGGTTTLTTVAGQPLTVKVTKAGGGAAIEINDVSGNKSYLETADVRQSNGMVHVVNGVLFPKLD